MELRSSAAEMPLSETDAGVASTRSRAIDIPKEVIASCSWVVSADRFLNLASSLHTKTGSEASSSRERGSNPSFLAIEKRSSDLADGETSASSLHQLGQ